LVGYIKPQKREIYLFMKRKKEMKEIKRRRTRGEKLQEHAHFPKMMPVTFS